MANKATKTLARTNAATLNRTHAITLFLHILFILYRLIFRSGSWYKYVLLTLPASAIEVYLEKLGRPRTVNGDLRAGEDLEAKGVTECLWDVVHATWILLVVVGVAGDWAWWGWLVIPAYGVYLAVATVRGLKAGLMPGVPEGEQKEEEISKRQKKLLKKSGGGRYICSFCPPSPLLLVPDSRSGVSV
ncbi:hypothetical protein RUND412_003210 [Rhizina undulata]